MNRSMEPEQNTNTQQPQQTENAFPPATETGSKNTMLVGVIAVIVVLAGLGWYMLESMNTVPPQEMPVALTPETTQVATETPTTTEVTPTTTQDAATAALSTQGTSDDLTAIDADLKATDLNSLNDVNKI